MASLTLALAAGGATALFGLIGIILAAGLVWSYAHHKRTTAFRFNGAPVPSTPWRPPVHDLSDFVKDIVGLGKRIERDIVEGASFQGKEEEHNQEHDQELPQQQQRQQRQQQTKGELVAMAIGPMTFLAPLSERIAKLCLTTSEMRLNRNLSNWGAVTRLLKGSIIASARSDWKRQHRVLSQLLTPGAVKEFRGIYASHARKLVASLTEQMDAKTGIANVEITALMNDLTCSVLFDSLFGNDVPESQRLRLLHAIKELINTANHPLSHFSFSRYLVFIPFVRRQNALFHIVNTETDAIIKERLRCAERNTLQPRCLIDHILLHNENAASSVDKFSLEEIRGNVRAFFAAGTDSTAQTLSWCLYELTRNKEEYRLVMDELAGLDFSDQNADHDDYPIPLAESRLFAFINECLRFYTPISITAFHDVSETLTLGSQADASELTLPKGSRFAVPPFIYHRLKSIWPDNPGRFTSTRMLGRFKSTAATARDYKFLPFGSGVRSCIGRHFSYNEMLWVLSRLLQEVEFLHDDTVIEPKVLFPLVTTGLLNVKCRRRRLKDPQN